ncbi:MAG: GspH/FimT family pseudopilin [Thermoanaerobaculia bacterium]|nr:GspH/FimT family pseudopilin [Thermoanaerobaculia bacterium]MBP9824125.1 GspH/FimT family pseudopilin [Thermoanaerobaculia bacterium]
MRAARRRTCTRQAGFTLIESLVVVAVIGILVLISAPAFLKMMNRFKLTGTTRELTSLMQAARQEAIKMNAPAQVNYDATSNSFFAFVDLDRDQVLSAPDRILAARIPVPKKVEFRGPGDAGVNGANAIDGWDDAPSVRLGPVFNPDGSADRVGSFRLKDSNDNFLEVRIQMPATGRIVLRKYFDAEDAFFVNGEIVGSIVHKWEWK